MECLLWIPWFIKRVYLGGVNQRNVFTLALNFCLNFSPIFIWLFMFKNAGVIPTNWRPPIWGSVAYYCDAYIFGDYWHSLDTRLEFVVSLVSSSIIGILFAVVPLFIWYYVYYTKKLRHNLFDETDVLLQYPLNYIGSSQFRPSRMRNVLPFLFLFFTFVMLNFDHLLSSQDPSNFTKFKDLLAWVMYVILHLTGPILTGVYLYVFHIPGTLKCFSFALGLQNIVGLFTHFLLPMAPPWFIHMYGAHDTAHLNYSQLGYAAGLTRVDMHLGTHLNSNGFHLSPIVFGAVPSLHSAMAVQCFFFLLFRSTQTKSVPESIATDAAPVILQKDEDDDYEMDEEQDEEEQGYTNVKVQPNKSIIPFEFEDDDFADDSDSVESKLVSHINSITLQTTNGGDDDLEARATTSDSDSELNTLAVAKILAKQQVLPVHILESKWLYIFHKGLLPKFLGTIFVCLQWWSTQYLDHHFRYDLFVGAVYAVISYILINKYVLQPKVIKPWLITRADPTLDKMKESKTMGMRVFENTKIEWFFDPLA